MRLARRVLTFSAALLSVSALGLGAAWMALPAHAATVNPGSLAEAASLAAGPAMASPGPGSLVLLSQASSGTLRERLFANSGWATWSRLAAAR